MSKAINRLSLLGFIMVIQIIDVTPSLAQDYQVKTLFTENGIVQQGFKSLKYFTNNEILTYTIYIGIENIEVGPRLDIESRLSSFKRNLFLSNDLNHSDHIYIELEKKDNPSVNLKNDNRVRI